MAISYKSTVHKPLDYTQPVDLNLLGKVLQFEQQQFDIGVRGVQSTIDSIAALDVVKGVDRQYLNAKLSNLVNTINNIGGVDYSDPNVQNQISGMSSQIYGDDKVINAVANTKKFRYVQNYYKDLKEKKPKEWNQANEWYDMNKFSTWLNDGQVGTSASGDAGAVTPYHDYEGDWQKIFDKIANSANIEVQWQDRGLMYVKNGKKYVSPDRIWATASQLLTPQQRTQLAIEGRYTYQNVPISELTKAYDQKLYNEVGESTAQLNDYKTKLKGATSLKDQQDYRKLIAEKEAEITKLTAPVKKGADQIKEKLYLDEKLRGLQARYSFSQATSTMQAASDKMFKLNYEMNKAKFSYQQQKDQLDRMVEMADKGLMWYTDPLGNRTVVTDPTSPRNQKKGKGSGSGSSTEGDYSSLGVMAGSPEQQNVQFSEKALDDRKLGLIKSNEQLFNKFVVDIGRKMGWTDVFINDLSDDGFLQGKHDPRAVKIAQDYKAAWDAMTRGETLNYDNVDPLFKNFMSKYQENQKEVEAIDKFYNNVDNQVRQKYGINNDTFNQYQKYAQAQKEVNRVRASAQAFNNMNQYYDVLNKAEANFEQVQAEISGGKTIPGTNLYQMPFDPKKMSEYFKNREAERTSLIQAGSLRYNLPGLTVSDDKDKNVAKMIATNAGTMQYYDQAGKAIGKATLNPSNITPITVGYDYIDAGGTLSKQPMMTFKIKTGSKPEDFTIAKVQLNPQQAPVFGFGKDIYDISGYRFALHANGEANDINTTSGKNYELKYDIVKYHPDDINDNSVFIRVRDKDNVISLYNQPFPSPELATQFMEGMTKQKSFGDAILVLDQLSKQ